MMTSKRRENKNLVSFICFSFVAKVIDKGMFRIQKTLESWHTANTDEVDNNSHTSILYIYIQFAHFTLVF